MAINLNPEERISQIQSSISTLLAHVGGWEVTLSPDGIEAIGKSKSNVVFLRVGVVKETRELYVQFGEEGRDDPPAGFSLDRGDLISLGRTIRRALPSEPEADWLCAVLQSAAPDLLARDAHSFHGMREARLSLVRKELTSEADQLLRERIATAWGGGDFEAVVRLIDRLGERATSSERFKRRLARDRSDLSNPRSPRDFLARSLKAR